MQFLYSNSQRPLSHTTTSATSPSEDPGTRSYRAISTLQTPVELSRSTRQSSSQINGRSATHQTLLFDENGMTTSTSERDTKSNNIRSTFSTAEKKAYISAVKCLSKLPPQTPAAECPGCRNRYDDFVATHIKQTFTVCGKVFMGPFPLLTLLYRFTTLETSYPGTDGTPTHMSRPSAQNATIRANSHTTTGRAGRMTLRNPQS